MLVEDLIFQYEADLEDGWQARLGIPEDWKIMKLADAVGQIDYGLSQSIPKSPPPNGIKIVSTADINREGDVLYGKIRTTETSLKIIERLALHDGDVLFNWRNSAELIGKTGVFESQPEPHIFASFILRIDCNNSLLHNFFLKHLMRYYRERGIFIKLSRRAVNQANYNKNEISQLRIPVPSQTEQKKIAYVLSMVQRAIAQQEQLIQTTTELKKALMHKLFTEGLHGEKQKETEIGLVPESWQILEFDEFTTLQRGKDLTKSQFEPGNIPVAGSNGIIGYHNQSNVKEAGVTVGRSGSVGRVKYYACDFWAHNTTLYVRDFHGNLPRFSAYFLGFLDLARFRTGASVPTLDRNTFRRMKIAVPRLPEQKKIAEILDLTDKKIDAGSRKLASLRELFRTLLHQLMTAQIRVHDIDFPGFDDLVNITPQGSTQRSG